MNNVFPPLTPTIELELRDTIGAELRRLRAAAALTQCETAARAGLTQRMLCYLERGERRPSRETLIRLACALDINSPGLAWTQALADRLEDITGPHMAGKTVPRPARDPERTATLRAELETLRATIRRGQDRLNVAPDFDDLRLMVARGERIAEDMTGRLEWLEAHPVTGH